jgi:ELWxxDGT repeat protein
MPTATVLLDEDNKPPKGSEQSLYFSVTTEETGRELYRIEAGSTTPTLVADINPGAESSDPMDFTEFGGNLYFRASTAEPGEELYRIEAGSSTPTLVADINPGPGWSQPSEFFVL